MADTVISVFKKVEEEVSLPLPYISDHNRASLRFVCEKAAESGFVFDWSAAKAGTYKTQKGIMRDCVAIPKSNGKTLVVTAEANWHADSVEGKEYAF